MADSSSQAPAIADAAHGDLGSQSDLGLDSLSARSVEPDFEQLIAAVVEQALAETEDPVQSMRGMADSLTRYFHDDNTATLLLTLLAYWDDQTYVASTLESIDDEPQRQRLVDRLSRLAARCGRQIRVRYDLTSREADDWQFIDARTYYEPGRSQWVIDVSLQTFAQHKTKIVGPPLSFLRLTNRLLELLTEIQPLQDGGVGAEFDEEAINSFHELAGRLTEALKESPDGSTGPDLNLPRIP